jgi:hypothetical protein
MAHQFASMKNDHAKLDRDLDLQKKKIEVLIQANNQINEEKKRLTKDYQQLE